MVRVSPPIPLHDSKRQDWVLAPRYTEEPLSRVAERVVAVRVCRPINPPRAGAFSDGDLEIEFVADLALDPADLPRAPDYAAEWSRTLARIVRFIDQHGHSDVPIDYDDEDGRLGGLVLNIRWFAAGRAGVSPGPFPGVGFQEDLDRLRGWSWDIDPETPGIQ